jgi:hypothetical protein
MKPTSQRLMEERGKLEKQKREVERLEKAAWAEAEQKHNAAARLLSLVVALCQGCFPRTAESVGFFEGQMVAFNAMTHSTGSEPYDTKRRTTLEVMLALFSEHQIEVESSESVSDCSYTYDPGLEVFGGSAWHYQGPPGPHKVTVIDHYARVLIDPEQPDIRAKLERAAAALAAQQPLQKAIDSLRSLGFENVLKRLRELL